MKRRIFQYAGITDVFWFSALPIAGIFIVFFIATIGVEIFTDINTERLRKKEQKYVTEGGAREEFRTRVSDNQNIISFLFFIFLCVPAVLFNPEMLVPLVGMMLITPIYSFLKKSGMFIEVGSDNIRSTLIVSTVALLPISYYMGKAQSIQIKKGFGLLYEISEPSNERKYLGHVNGTLFLLQNNDSEVVIIKNKEEILLKKKNVFQEMIENIESKKNKS